MELESVEKVELLCLLENYFEHDRELFNLKGVYAPFFLY
jgi:hypothetical protein